MVLLQSRKNSSRNPEPFLTLVRMLHLAGRPAWELTIGLDMLRAAGWGYLGLHHRDSRELERRGQGPRDAVYRSIWAQAAAEVGAELHDLAPGFLELSTACARTRVRHQSVMLDDIVTIEIALQKTLVDRLLVDAGLPVPEHVEFDLGDFHRAVAFLEHAPSGCVVKPTSSAGGAGVTAGIRSRSELLRATLKASRFFRRLAIEHQAAGDVYRLLYLDGKLLDVVRRSSPRVVGDGQSTVAELIAAENRRRARAHGSAGLTLLRIDLDCLFTLARTGLSLSTVPSSGAAVIVKTVTNQNGPSDNETVLDLISEEVIAAGATAARAVGLRLAGVDLITTDLRQSLAETDGVIIEVNGCPGLHHHYHVAQPALARHVAVPVLRAALDEAADRTRVGLSYD